MTSLATNGSAAATRGATCRPGCGRARLPARGRWPGAAGARGRQRRRDGRTRRPQTVSPLFAGSVAQLCTLVVVIVAAASLAIDARPGVAAFYRTRLRRPTRLVLPRYLTITAAAIAAFALGTLGARYETTVLLGPIRPADLAAGFGLETVSLCFATAVAAVFTSVVRSVLGAVGWALACLLGLAALSAVPAISSWLPTRLKLIQAAQDHWRSVSAPHLVALVRAGAVVSNGVLIERPGQAAA